MDEYGIVKASIWASEQEIKDEIFDPDSALKPMEINFVDIPYCFENTEQGFELIYALSHFEDVSLFGLGIVQLIIDYQYDFW